MAPGQLSLGFGVLGAVRADGGVGALSVRAITPLSKKVHLDVLAGGFLDSTGKVSARDVQIGVPIYAVSKANLRVRVTPGLSLPLGSTTSGLEYTLLTTGSFDPTLGADLAAGGTWLFVAGANLRSPLHPGFDRVRQGLYGTGELRVARRVGSGALSLGTAFAAQQTRGFTSPGFLELAAVAGGAMALGDTWAAQANLRVPVWTDPSPPPYRVALALGLTHVFRKKNPEHH